ncbi:TetR/AcrR family transcriptional regulator [Aeromicrobium ginsengisoli]|uniref:TetR/AcrR family transcriptional regulator n=1 Tax=Aeromicrobium ginsengisoli TaxID=363867 RepID=A0A5M4FBC6_9ACTN|nr:TetR/AcrR family transcriptional regulator [Aeromicrobium ginsengisoli]KAA1395668.1 TetR/AcrR family transcriptional regulator [Aeromicrobium ginsengisoli]
MNAKPGRPRTLTVDQIIDAVLAEGLDTFSMPSIAGRLGVVHSGLYRYFTDREDLVVQVMDRIARNAPWPSTDLPWREHLEQLGEMFWTLCGQYPGYDLTALRSRNVSPGFLEMVMPHIESLQREGLDVVDATAAVEFVRGLVLMSSIDAARLSYVESRGDLPEHEVPGFADPEKWAGRGWYRRHLNTWFDGLAQRVVALQPSTAV